MPRHRNGVGAKHAETGEAIMPYGGTYGVMSQIREEFDRMFDRFLHHWPSMGTLPTMGQSSNWDLEVRDEDKTVAVRADLPGFSAGDIDLQVANERLTIRASHKSDIDKEEEGWTRQRHDYFQSVLLPAAVDEEKINARFRNGVLTVRLPKSENTYGRRIQIRAD